MFFSFIIFILLFFLFASCIITSKRKVEMKKPKATVWQNTSFIAFTLSLIISTFFIFCVFFSPFSIFSCVFFSSSYSFWYYSPFLSFYSSFSFTPPSYLSSFSPHCFINVFWSMPLSIFILLFKKNKLYIQISSTIGNTPNRYIKSDWYDISYYGKPSHKIFHWILNIFIEK